MGAKGSFYSLYCQLLKLELHFSESSFLYIPGYSCPTENLGEILKLNSESISYLRSCSWRPCQCSQKYLLLTLLHDQLSSKLLAFLSETVITLSQNIRIFSCTTTEETLSLLAPLNGPTLLARHTWFLRSVGW